MHIYFIYIYRVNPPCVKTNDHEEDSNWRARKINIGNVLR